MERSSSSRACHGREPRTLARYWSSSSWSFAAGICVPARGRGRPGQELVLAEEQVEPIGLDERILRGLLDVGAARRKALLQLLPQGLRGVALELVPVGAQLLAGVLGLPGEDALQAHQAPAERQEAEPESHEHGQEPTQHPALSLSRRAEVLQALEVPHAVTMAQAGETGVAQLARPCSA